MIRRSLTRMFRQGRQWAIPTSHPQAFEAIADGGMGYGGRLRSKLGYATLFLGFAVVTACAGGTDDGVTPPPVSPVQPVAGATPEPAPGPSPPPLPDPTPPPTDPTPVPPVEALCEDWDVLEAPEYTYLNNVWGKQDTTDYDQCVMRRVVDGNDEYGWNWRWPAPSDRVRVYPEVLFGWHPHRRASTTSQLPRRISSLSDLYVNYDAYLTATGVYNAAFEMWLTTEDPPSPETITTEIMIWVDRTWDLETSSLIDSVDVGGVTFAVYLRPEHVSASGVRHVYVAFVSHTDQFSGTLDLKRFLDYLVDREVISADDYVSVVEFGTEVKHGTGELWLKEFEVNVR